jgi:anti-sigma28 factor (negative regulator of flagellin synthesis)
MSSLQLLRQARPAATTTLRLLSRPFSAAAVRAAPEAANRGDAINKREKAAEDMYVRKQEQEKLAALKKKIADGEAQLEKDRKELDDASKK